MNKFSKEIQIGLVAVVGVVVLYFGLFHQTANIL